MLFQSPKTLPLVIPAYQPIQDTQQIVRLAGAGNYTTIHLRGNPKPLMVSQTLKHFESQLPHFIRVSKSSIINPTHVCNVISEEDKVISLRLIDGASIPVSRRRTAETLARLVLVS